MNSMLRKISLLTFVILCVPFLVFADEKREEVGPGIVYCEVVSEDVPWQIRTVKVDLTSEYLYLDAALAQDGIRSGLERASSISKRLEQPEDHVAVAVNADFWGGHREPLGMMVMDGELIRSPYARAVFVQLADGDLLIDNFQLQAYVDSVNGSSIEITGVNRWDKGGPILFTEHIGQEIPSGEKGKGIVLDPMGNILTNKCDLACTVATEVVHRPGGAPMPRGKFILWFPDGDLRGLKEGDEVIVHLEIKPDHGPIETAVGGGPKIVEKGALVANAGSFSTTRHPRTAVGFNEDRTELILLVVDGRQPGWSLGMSLTELGEAMIQAGAFEAMNLDGGGSSTMVVWHEVKNRPSDNTGERTVANALLVRSTAPGDNLVQISILPPEVKVIPESTFQLQVRAKDEFNQPVALDESDLQWSEDETASGSVSDTGLFTVGEETGETIVTAEAKGLGGLARIIVEKPVALKIVPEKINVAVGRERTVEITSLGADGNALRGTPAKPVFRFQGECGEITEEGVFKAAQTGEGEIEVQIAGISRKIPVLVSDTYQVMVEDFEDLSDWTVSVTRADESASGLIETREHLKFGDKVGKLFYKMQSGGTSAVYMNTKSKSWKGSGDAAQLWVYGNGSNHQLKAEIEDEDGERFLVTFGYINWKDEWRQMKVSFAGAAPHWANANAKMDTIIGLNNIYIVQTSEKRKDQGEVFFDDLEVFTSY